jgi:uroporphyrinogen-III synthase
MAAAREAAERGPLDGRVIALPETRELDLFAEMLEKRGARTLRCPLVAILDAPDAGPIEAWLKRCIAGQHDDLVLLTGEGLRRLTGFAERAGLRDDFVSRLAKMRKITRGPKPARALRDLGLRSELAASEPTTEGLIADLGRENLQGRRIGVQLYGQEPNRRLVDFLVSAGATVDVVAPYIYAGEADTGRVHALIESLAGGGVDAMAFTSSPQVRRLFDVARAAGLESTLMAGLARVTVAAVGPLVADALRQKGVRVDLVPADSFFLKPLVNGLAAQLSAPRHTLPAPGGMR